MISGIKQFLLKRSGYRFPHFAGWRPALKKPTWFHSLHLPRISRLAVFLVWILCLLIICVTFGVTYKKDQDSPHQYTQVVGDAITLTGYPRQVDLDNKMVSIRWKLGGCGTYNYHTPGCGDECSRAVDLYVGGSLTPTFSYDPGTSGFWLSISGNNDFSTDHQISSPNQSKVPFDSYNAVIAVIAIDKATNESIPVWSSVNSLVQNFDVSSSIGDYGYVTADTYNRGIGPFIGKLLYSFTSITVKRSKLSRAFTICLLMLNWALTAASVWVTTTIFSKREKPPGAVLLFPLTLIVTIPALRSLYVGSPPLGILIDVIGLFPQMITVAICCVFSYCFSVRTIPVQNGSVV